MKLEINVPKAGLTMTEAEITSWLVSEGDYVEKDAPVAELMTEKITVEVTAPDSGTLDEILKSEGEEVQVGETIANLLTEGGSSKELSENKHATETIASKSNKGNQNSSNNNDDDKNDYDIAVVGGGPGGYVAAIRAAQLGGKVVLIDQSHLGGVCLNSGCIPSKTLLKGAEYFKLHARAKEYGIEYGEPTIDFSALLQKKDSIVEKLRGGIDYLLKNKNIKVLNGRGEIVDSNTIKVTENNENVLNVNTNNIILATGSETYIPDIPGLKESEPLTSESALEKSDLPKSIAIVGAGAIGCEFAGIYAPLGVEVTLIESESNILPGFDPDVSEYLKKHLKEDGVKVLTSTKVKEVTNEKSKKIYLEGENSNEELVVEDILVATGRKARVEDLSQLDLAIENGVVKVDNKLKTNVESVYAIGDLNGIDNLAHVASAEGVVAAENSMGKDITMYYDHIPKCIYTSPEVASAGINEAEAKERNLGYQVGKYNFQGNGRAQSNNTAEGFVKVIRDTKYNQILGIQIISENASELIAQAVQIMELEGTAEELGTITLPHPSLSEGLMESALNSMGIGIHS